MRVSAAAVVCLAIFNSGLSFGQGVNAGEPKASDIARQVDVGMSWFYSPSFNETKDGIPVKNSAGEILIRGLKEADWCKLSRFGSGVVKRLDGSMVTVNFQRSVGQKIANCHQFYSDGKTSENAIFFSSKSSYGEGATGYFLTPFKSLITNIGKYPIGSLVFVPSIKGRKYVDFYGKTQTHDGYFLVADTVSDEGNPFLNIFTGVDSNKPFPELLSSEIVTGNRLLKSFLVFDKDRIDSLNRLHSPPGLYELTRLHYVQKNDSSLRKYAFFGSSVEVSSGKLRLVSSIDSEERTIGLPVIRMSVLSSDIGTRIRVKINGSLAARLGGTLDDNYRPEILGIPEGISYNIIRNIDQSFEVEFVFNRLIKNSEILISMHHYDAVLSEIGGGEGNEYPMPKYPFRPGLDINLVGKKDIDLAELAKLLNWDYDESPIDAMLAGKLGNRPTKEIYSRKLYNEFPLLNYISSKKYCVPGDSTRNWAVISLAGDTDFDAHGVHADLMGAGPDNCYVLNGTIRLHEGADIRAAKGTPIYAVFDSVSSSWKKSPTTGVYLTTNLGTFQASNGEMYDINFRYLHLNPCSLPPPIKNSFGPVNSGQLVGYAAANAFEGVKYESPRYYEIVKMRTKDENPYKCMIGFTSHLHIDVMVNKRANTKGDYRDTSFFVDPILFIKYVQFYNSRSQLPILPSSMGKATPVFEDWGFTTCDMGGGGELFVTLGTPDYCSIRVKIKNFPSNAKPIGAIFSYELFYKKDGVENSIALPDADGWQSKGGISNVTANISDDSYEFRVPISVRFRSDRIYTKIRLIGRISFDNGKKKTIVRDMPLKTP